MDRSSRPHRSPRRTRSELEQRVLDARERTGWGPRLIAGETGVAHSTVHAILRRHGRSRAPRAARREFVRYEWPCPGDLLHMDVKRYPRFRRPGHAVTGDRRRTNQDKVNALGHDYFHAIVDDHSRLAYGELLDDERATTVTAFVERALAWFAGRGITTRRVMTDGAWSYTHNRALAELLAHNGIRHIVTPPYTPRWNGKVERFHRSGGTPLLLFVRGGRVRLGRRDARIESRKREGPRRASTNTSRVVCQPPCQVRLRRYGRRRRLVLRRCLGCRPCSRAGGTSRR
jgi:transposase InsO family protein